MRQLKLLFNLIGMCLLLGLSSCVKEDKGAFGDDFDIPELTDANTIQFTVDATGEWKALEIMAGGGRIAIDWGDGRLQKIEKLAYTPIQYRYKPSKSFRVRVWAEELDLFTVSGLLIPVSNIRLGDLPKMKNIDLNSIKETKELDLNVSCPNLEYVSIGNWEDLEHLDFDQCSRLQSIQIYTNPKLTSLTFGNHSEVNNLSCSYTGLTALSLKGVSALRSVDISDNSALTRLELNEANKIHSLQMQGCAFSSVKNILKCCPSLNELICSYNKLTELDLSHLPISKLHCDHNQLTSLLVKEGSLLGQLYCHSNELDEEALNTLFNSLGQAIEPSSYYPIPSNQYRISFNDNPGTDKCNKEILKDKKWIIENN